MFKEKALLTFYAETAVHMGAGQAVSYVDLPVQRERITSFPTLWSTGIKGVIRELAERVWFKEFLENLKNSSQNKSEEEIKYEAIRNSKQKVNIIFGPEEESSAYASCLSITDAKILLYPVRSVRGVFAWITCPFSLKRFKKDLESAGIQFKNGNEEITIPDPSDDDKIIISSNSALKLDNNTVALEEFVFNIENGKETDAQSIANSLQKFIPQNEMITSLCKSIAIVSDNVFKDFVNYAVEIRTRIRIDQTTGTVEEKALFSEELIPSESIFYSMVFITDPYFGVKRELYEKLLDFKRKNKDKYFSDGFNSLSDEEKGNLNKYKDQLEKAWDGKYFSACEVKSSLDFLDNYLLQLGGDETTGKGFMRAKLIGGAK